MAAEAGKLLLAFIGAVAFAIVINALTTRTVPNANNPSVQSNAYNAGH